MGSLDLVRMLRSRLLHRQPEQFTKTQPTVTLSRIKMVPGRIRRLLDLLQPLASWHVK
jgi:hypothetical protein